MTDRAPAAASAHGRRAGRAFQLLAWSLAACVLVQVSFAGLAIFADPRGWLWHRNFVYAFGPIPLVMLGLAFAGRLPARMRWGAAAAFVLVFLQYTTVGIGGLVGAVHPVNALLLFALSLGLAREAGAELRAE